MAKKVGLVPKTLPLAKDFSPLDPFLVSSSSFSAIWKAQSEMKDQV